MLRPGLLLSALLLAACGASNDTSQTSVDTSASETNPSTGAATDSTGDTSDTVAPTTGTSDTPTTGTTDTGDAFCGGWQGADGELALALFDKDDKPLMDGATLPLECGAQGLFMFGLYPTFGGFTPASQNLEFTVEVDVEGYNTNPDGHFYSADPVGYYVGCEPLDGGVSGVVPVFPLDNLADLTVLDGLFAGIHLVLHTEGGDITRDLQVKLAVVEDKTWAFCSGG